jgi:hypothetical protein
MSGYHTAMLLRSAMIAIVLALPTSATGTRAHQDKATATFDLDNRQQGVLRIGRSQIVAVSAWATHKPKEPPYPTPGLEILFFKTPITDADKPALIADAGHNNKKGDFAAIILFLDKEGQISQVNMSFIVPGTTVVRTVGYIRAELATSFPDFSFDGKRLRLRSKSSFTDLNDKKEPMTLSWDIDIDVPVVEYAGK